MMLNRRAIFLLCLGFAAWLPDCARSQTSRQVDAIQPAIAAANLSPVSIRFKDQASVDGDKILLGDVARVIAGDERIVAQLETLEVAKSAGFGLTRMVDTDALFSRSLKGFSDRYLFDYDHKAVRVTTRANTLPADTLARLVDKFLAAQPKAPGQVRHWEIARAPDAIQVPLAPHSLELSFVGSRRKGKVEVNLAIRGETRVIRNIPITLNLRLDEPVLVAKRQIARGEALGPDNVSVETRETTLINDIVISKPGKLIGNIAKVTIIPGRIVTPNMLALPPLVKRGQEAKIIFHNGGVSVSADAVCRQDGVSGQIITAKSLANNRLVRVRVTDEGMLEPVPGG